MLWFLRVETFLTWSQFLNSTALRRTPSSVISSVLNLLVASQGQNFRHFSPGHWLLHEIILMCLYIIPGASEKSKNDDREDVHHNRGTSNCPWELHLKRKHGDLYCQETSKRRCQGVYWIQDASIVLMLPDVMECLKARSDVWREVERIFWLYKVTINFKARFLGL